MDDFQHVVAGQRMNITLFDFKLRACRYLENEQLKANPDSALIALLCESVRLAREHEADMRRPISTASDAAAAEIRDTPVPPDGWKVTERPNGGAATYHRARWERGVLKCWECPAEWTPASAEVGGSQTEGGSEHGNQG